MSPEVGGLNEVLSRLSSCSKPLTGSTEDTLERIIRASLCSVRSLSCTETTIGDWNVFCCDPSPPTTVIFWLNVTGVSNVVTSAPISSLSSSLSARTAASRNVSSPVIALILRLPI